MTYSLLTVQITPKSSKNQIVGWTSDEQGRPVLKIKIAAVAEDGRANQELIAFLANILQIPKSAITLLRGEIARIKQLKIQLDEAELRKRLT